MKLLLALVLISISGIVFADNSIDAKVEAALAADSRPAADRERDRNRQALATLNFFGMKDDMKVLELIPGGGWYTRLLAPTLAENGELFVAIGAGRVKDGLMTEPGFEKVSHLETSDNIRRLPGERLYTMDDFEFGEDDFDMVLTFRNMHNFKAEGRHIMNKQVFDSLKSGGLYGIVDHTRRHMQAINDENRRRVDPVVIIKELLDAGFEFVDFSDLHYKMDDELIYEVGRRSVSGNTDRFTLLFRKP